MLNLGAIFFSLKAARIAWKPYDIDSKEPDSFVFTALFLLIGFLMITSYGFLFSIERGNSDIYAQFFAVLALLALIQKPGNRWIATILVAASAHLKLYPAILFVLIFWKYRWKAVLPILLVNVLMFLMTGPYNAYQYVIVMLRYVPAPFLWTGNHSFASFALMVNDFLNHRGYFSIPSSLFLILPLVLWIVGPGFYGKEDLTL